MSAPHPNLPVSDTLLNLGPAAVTSLSIGVNISTQATVLLPAIRTRNVDLRVNGRRCPGVVKIDVDAHQARGDAGELWVRRTSEMDWDAVIGAAEVVIVINDPDTGGVVLEIPLRNVCLGAPAWWDDGKNGTIRIQNQQQGDTPC